MEKRPGLQEKKLLRSTADSFSRLAEARSEVARSANHAPVEQHVRNLTKPNSVSRTMKTVGMALLSSPDVVTDVPAVALVAGSYVMKKKDPTKLDDIATETRKILRDLQSLSL